MTRDEIIEKLKEREADLRAQGGPTRSMLSEPERDMAKAELEAEG
jgi:hypothetical protein